MNFGKYLIVRKSNYKVAILFDELITHDSFLQVYSKSQIWSAGFFQVIPFQIHDSYTIKVSAFGKSKSLKIVSAVGDDILLKRVLRLL